MSQLNYVNVTLNPDFLKGQLKTWNDDKGFGFISSEDGKQDTFLHISSLKHLSRRPIVGDTVFYQTHTGSDGKKRAINVKIVGVPTKPLKVGQHNESNWQFKLLAPICLIAISFIFYNLAINKTVAPSTSHLEAIPTTAPEQNTGVFSCNGKVYCSQMSSCAEATYYQNNCPGTKMDGDSDGIPCESQWCN